MAPDGDRACRASLFRHKRFKVGNVLNYTDSRVDVNVSPRSGIVQSGAPDSPLATARFLTELGLVVIPLNPGRKSVWKGTKLDEIGMPTGKQLSSWWQNTCGRSGLYRNIAVLTGRKSGGLVVRDFDDTIGFRKWQAEHPELADTLPALKTYRGYHVYARMAIDDLPTQTEIRCYGGELKCGMWATTAPSYLKEEAFSYSWENPLDEKSLLTVTFDQLHVPKPLSVAGEVASPSLRSHTPSTLSTLSTLHGTSVTGGKSAAWAKAREAVESIAIGHPGTTNSRCFDLCRALRGVSNATGYQFDESDLVEVATNWFERWHHAMGDPDLASVEYKICYGYPKAKFGLGDNPQFEAASRLAVAEIPVYPNLALFDPLIHRLIVLMREMHRVVGGEFHISNRHAAIHIGLVDRESGEKALDVAARKITHWFDTLRRRGFIDVVKRGSFIERISNHYVYKWDDL